MDEYTDEIQIPVMFNLCRKERNKSELDSYMILLDIYL